MTNQAAVLLWGGHDYYLHECSKASGMSVLLLSYVGLHTLYIHGYQDW